jgi:glycosyltransferase involved in cell wall biosynthesis
MTPTPELSVVVPSVNGLANLQECLDALEIQRIDVALEVLVIDRVGPALREAVLRRFPGVRVLDAAPGTSIPALRAMAFRAATAPAVAVIEDHVIVPRGWARSLCDAWRETPAVVGGSVANGATDRLVDRAAFLCEYSHCLPPLRSGPADWLTGNNVVYSRSLLQRYEAEVNAGKWEHHLHDALRRDGVALVCRPEICVAHKKHYTVREYLAQRYLYARAYAGERVKGAPLVKRLAFGAAALALPPILLARTAGRVVTKRLPRADFVRALPLIALFVGSWSVGEVVGYCIGPNDAMAKVC